MANVLASTATSLAKSLNGHLFGEKAQFGTHHTNTTAGIQG